MSVCRRIFGRGPWNKSRRVLLLVMIVAAGSIVLHYTNTTGDEPDFRIISYRNLQNISNVSSRKMPSPSASGRKNSSSPPVNKISTLQSDAKRQDLRDTTLTATELGYVPEGYKGREVVDYFFSEIIKQAGPGYTLITMFHLFTGQNVEGYDKETIDSLVTRNSEYMSVIKDNIDHPQLKRLILLYTNVTTMKILLRQNWPNVTKVYPLKMERMIHMTDFFNISSKYLIDEPVIGSNGDIIIGEGFDLIDTEKLRDTKTIYSLTRHGNKGHGDCEAASMCLMKYYGSHDTHIFRLKESLGDKVLSILNYPVNLQQAENGMIGTMTMEAGFTVYNPCSILTTYHVHCSRIGTRYIRGHNSIRNAPWLVKKIKTSPPVRDLRYGPSKPAHQLGRKRQ